MGRNDVTELPRVEEDEVRDCQVLLKRAEEFQGKKAHFPG
jgi:hypothetical protein